MEPRRECARTYLLAQCTGSLSACTPVLGPISSFDMASCLTYARPLAAALPSALICWVVYRRASVPFLPKVAVSACVRFVVFASKLSTIDARSGPFFRSRGRDVRSRSQDTGGNAHSGGNYQQVGRARSYTSLHRTHRTGLQVPDNESDLETNCALTKKFRGKRF